MVTKAGPPAMVTKAGPRPGPGEEERRAPRMSSGRGWGQGNGFSKTGFSGGTAVGGPSGRVILPDGLTRSGGETGPFSKSEVPVDFHSREWCRVRSVAGPGRGVLRAGAWWCEMVVSLPGRRAALARGVGLACGGGVFFSPRAGGHSPKTPKTK